MNEYFISWETEWLYYPAPLKLRPYGAIEIQLLLLLLQENVTMRPLQII